MDSRVVSLDDVRRAKEDALQEAVEKIRTSFVSMVFRRQHPLKICDTIVRQMIEAKIGRVELHGGALTVSIEKDTALFILTWEETSGSACPYCNKYTKQYSVLPCLSSSSDGTPYLCSWCLHIYTRVSKPRKRGVYIVRQ